MWNVFRQRDPKEETRQFFGLLPGNPPMHRLLNIDGWQYYVHCKEPLPMDVDFMLSDSLEVILCDPEVLATY
jgi:hypothetical protein